jgi:hypothetical protein
VAQTGVHTPPAPPPRTHPSRPLAVGLLAGGTSGNEVLTALTGAVLIMLLAVLGVTIVRIGQLLWVHLFLGALLLGPVALKLLSTGYRFVRYYSRNPAYVEHGPPELALRLIGPAVVLSTLVVFASGIVLLLGGPGTRAAWLPVHKVSFFVWVAFTSVHVLGHLQTVAAGVRSDYGRGDHGPALEHLRGGRVPGRNGRTLALASALALGAVLAVLATPQFGAWTRALPTFHHHRRRAAPVGTAVLEHR